MGWYLSPEGATVQIPDDQAPHALEVGYKPIAPQQAGPGLTQPETDVTGAAGTAAAGISSALSGATLGASDAFLAAIGDRGSTEALRQAREAHPALTTGATIGGAIAAAALTGGDSLIGAPTRLAATGGRELAAVGEAAGLGRVGGALLGGAGEGALYGAGQGVSELALSDDPLTVEHIASSLSSNMLYGAGLGGALGAGGKLVELGLGKAKGAIDDALARRAAAKATTPAEAIASGDLQNVNPRVLDTAEKSELERITKEQAPQRKAVVDELDQYRNANRDSHALREIAVGADDPNIREAGGSFTRNDIQLRRMLDNRAGFAESPARARPFLQAQEQALTEIGAWAKTTEQTWRREVADAPMMIREQILAKQVPGELGPFTPSGLDMAVDRVLEERQRLQWGGAIRGGLKEPAVVRLAPEYEKVLEWNRRVQAKLDEITKPPTSDLLTKIGEARDALGVPKVPSAGQAVLSAVAPFAGPLGVAAAAGGRVLGNFRKIAGAATERVGKMTSAFLGGAEKVAARAPLATRALASVSYSDDKKRPTGTTLPDLYKARTDEVKEQVHIAPDGSFQMRPEARVKMAAKLDGIRAVDPRLADQLETIGARRIAYLASIMPRLPDYGVMQVGPERGRIPELEMRGWARAVGALENPDAVFERAAHGVVLPQEAAAIRAVYPEKLAEITKRYTEQLSLLPKRLPRKRLLALSILTGVPFDAAMTPAVLRAIQGMYASEPGTKGGTQAPTPQPQFGSVKADKGTQAQQRQGEHQ
jgi:hypothetical protein